MGKTPSAKTRKATTTPKTLPKKMKGTTTMENESSNRLSLRRAKLEYDGTSLVASICTPNRTTRSMAKVMSNDIPSPVSTASKRKTIASSKSSAQQLWIRDDTAESDPITKIFETQSKRKSVRSRKSTKKIESETEAAAVSSEDDMPSVSMLDTDKPVGQFVRSRKSVKKQEAVVESSEDDLPSMSNLVSEKPVGKLVRSRKSMKDAKTKDKEESKVDLPSDSMLVTDNTNGKFVRPVTSTNTKNDESEFESCEEDLPSVSMLNTDKPSGRFVRSRRAEKKQESAVESSEDDLPSVSMLITDKSAGPIGQTNKSKKNGESDFESCDDDLPSVSMLVTEKPIPSRKSIEDTKLVAEPKNRRSSARRSANLVPVELTDTKPTDSNTVENENQQKMPDAKVEESAPNETTVPLIEMEDIDDDEANKNDESMTVAEDVQDFPQSIKHKNLIKNRISIIDLTESPMPSKETVLNATFSPEKKSEAVNEEAKDQTFTGETGINDKTFSPVPAPLVKKLATPKNVTATGTAQLKMPKSVTKSTVKKPSPQLKRLQGTPLRKPIAQNNLNTSAKLSSAKKSKMAETAAELAKPGASKNIPKITVDSPKVYKFGTPSNADRPFRFSLLAPELRVNATQNNKSTVKAAPNFNQMHNRLFKKTESIDEVRNRHEQRAKLLLSGKKPATAQKKAENTKVQNVQKPKVQREIRDDRRPLAHVNRARLNDEQRQERRRELFKQSSKRNNPNAKEKSLVEIKGVRLNRRFHAMMETRLGKNPKKN